MPQRPGRCLGVRPGFASLSSERVRLAILLAVLASLVAYLAMSGTGAFGILGSSSRTWESCSTPDGSSAVTVRQARLPALRAALRRIVFFDRNIQPYEEGPVPSDFAWTDAEPAVPRGLPSTARVQGSYEMRWWMANGDDVVADVMVFARRGQAGDYLTHASSTRCRPASVALAASFPPGGRNLEWRNPDGYAQEDLYLSRGRRVYRVAVVAAGASGSIAPAARSTAFLLVNGLACALPGADCQLADGTTPVAAAAGRLPGFRGARND